MAETKTCPNCGSILPEDAPSGICPRCLMKAGLETDPSATSAAEMNPTTGWTGFVPPTAEHLAQFFPQLEILELLGRGGMGAVYKARQPGLDRLVAVKILPPEIGNEAAFAERFAREARALAKLSHQNIVSVFDFGKADGQYYFVMEYVDGANLRQVIETGGLQPGQALAIVPQICEALQFAHDEGIVHRDIKPENILVDKQGRVKIADFGLAKLLGRAPADVALTGTHQVMGTPRYMAPEQMQGSSAVDHRADIYSLGVVFYEMLTGDLPLGRFDPPSKKAQIDVRLDEVVLRSLESVPERRYQHASDVKTEVESIVDSDAQLAAPETDQVKSLRAKVRNELRYPAAGLMAAGILNLLAIIFWVVLRVAAGEGLDASGQTEATVLTIIFALVSMAMGILLLVGSARMFDLQSFPMAMTAAIAGMLPLALGFVISLPMGIWALMVLSRRDARTAFADWQAQPPADQSKKGPTSMIGLCMAYGAVAGLCLGTAIDQNAMPIYLSLGLIVGTVVGAMLDSNNRRPDPEE